MPCWPPTSNEVAILLQNYYAACAAGRLAEAHELADRALKLDPACFGKTRGTGIELEIKTSPVPPLPRAAERMEGKNR
jgi:hypothetical protein